MSAGAGAETALRGTPETAEGAPASCVMVIFGASGDVTRRMLLPALYNLFVDRRLPPRFSVVGFGRTPWSDQEFRNRAREAVAQYSRRPPDPAVWRTFARNLHYLAGQYGAPDDFGRLGRLLGRIQAREGIEANHLYYLALPPSAVAAVVSGLPGIRRPRHEPTQGWTRVIVEKPFGRDLAGARELNRLLHRAFAEDDIFRIDHYLGKETVQNILVFRFANGIFEPIWNRRYVEHVQITVAESLGVGERGSYYEETGALRDMVQNHMMQLLCLVAMEPPIAFNGRAVRDEKVKVLHAVRHLVGDEVRQYTARGQYGRGWVGGEEARAYREEPEVSPESSTETFVALRLFIDNWRWAGVPFYLRTGKRLPKRSTEVAIEFKRAPHLLFRDLADVSVLDPNILAMRIQPNEGMTLKFLTKVPGSPIRIRPASMDFLYGASFRLEAPSAYETLLTDALRGDATLFTRSDEVEAAWGIAGDILEAWGSLPPPKFPNYEAGTWGPEEADWLMARDGRRWRRL